MESFMSRYLKGEIINEEIKKHGLTEKDLLYISQQYLRIKTMLEQYQAAIFNKKEQSEKIMEELENSQKIAKLLSFLGESYEVFTSTLKYEMLSCVDDKDFFWNTCLNKNLSNYYFKTMNFIIYLLSRQGRNYLLYCIQDGKGHFGDALKYGLGDVNIMASETDLPVRFYQIDECKNYLNQLYKNRKSFILTVNNDDCNGNFYYRELYEANTILSSSKEIAILGGHKYKTICFLGDDVFREVMTKLMLFSQLHGFCAKNIDNEKQQEIYAQAVESMDISSYSMEISNRIWPNYFTLSNVEVAKEGKKKKKKK